MLAPALPQGSRPGKTGRCSQQQQHFCFCVLPAGPQSLATRRLVVVVVVGVVVRGYICLFCVCVRVCACVRAWMGAVQRHPS